MNVYSDTSSANPTGHLDIVGAASMVNNLASARNYRAVGHGRVPTVPSYQSPTGPNKKLRFFPAFDVSSGITATNAHLIVYGWEL